MLKLKWYELLFEFCLLVLLFLFMFSDFSIDLRRRDADGSADRGAELIAEPELRKAANDNENFISSYRDLYTIQ